jgi:hypothetical protein
MKAHSGGTATTLDIPLPHFEDSIEVFPAAGQEEALSLEYPSGAGYATVDLSLSRVAGVDGTSSGFRADTPRTDGDGPVVLSRDGTSFTFSTGATIERALGRPNVDVRARYTDYPKVTDQRTSSYDAFSITLASERNAAQRVRKLRDMFRQRTGLSTFTLSFNGVYGMGEFTVMPQGSAALRNVHTGGRDDNEDMSVPEIALRVVTDQ